MNSCIGISLLSLVYAFININKLSNAMHQSLYIIEEKGSLRIADQDATKNSMLK